LVSIWGICFVARKVFGSTHLSKAHISASPEIQGPALKKLVLNEAEGVSPKVGPCISGARTHPALTFGGDLGLKKRKEFFGAVLAQLSLFA